MIFWRCDNKDCEGSKLPERPIETDGNGVPLDPEALVCAVCQNEHKPGTLKHRERDLEPIVVEPDDEPDKGPIHTS